MKWSRQTLTNFWKVVIPTFLCGATGCVAVVFLFGGYVGAERKLDAIFVTALILGMWRAFDYMYKDEEIITRVRVVEVQEDEDEKEQLPA